MDICCLMCNLHTRTNEAFHNFLPGCSWCFSNVNVAKRPCTYLSHNFQSEILKSQEINKRNLKF